MHAAWPAVEADGAVWRPKQSSCLVLVRGFRGRFQKTAIGAYLLLSALWAVRLKGKPETRMKNPKVARISGATAPRFRKATRDNQAARVAVRGEPGLGKRIVSHGKTLVDGASSA